MSRRNYFTSRCYTYTQRTDTRHQKWDRFTLEGYRIEVRADDPEPFARYYILTDTDPTVFLDGEACMASANRYVQERINS